MTTAEPGAGLAVQVLDDSLRLQAEALSKALSLPLVPAAETRGFLFLLTPAAGRLELRPADGRLHGAVYADLLDPGIKRRIHGGRRQPMARACGLQKLQQPRILDATAGLGRDGAVLAGLGCQVSLFERSPAVAALLGDALERARSRETAPSWLLNGLTLTRGDARDHMTRNASLPTAQRHDVVFLDPMFPHRDKTALASKEMRALRAVAGDDDDAGALLEAAMGYALRRVVSKRPPWAEPIVGPPPDHQISGKLARYDVYLIKASDG